MWQSRRLMWQLQSIIRNYDIFNSYLLPADCKPIWEMSAGGNEGMMLLKSCLVQRPEKACVGTWDRGQSTQSCASIILLYNILSYYLLPFLYDWAGADGLCDNGKQLLLRPKGDKGRRPISIQNTKQDDVQTNSIW